MRRLLIKILNDSSSLWRARAEDFYFGFYQMHRLSICCLSTFPVWREHYSLQRIFGMKLWAGFFWLSSCSHCPLCRASGWDRVTAVWKGCSVFAPRNSAGAGHSLQCCTLAWFSGCSNKAVSSPACSDELVPHPCCPVWKGKPLCVDYYSFMSLCGSGFRIIQYVSLSVKNFIPPAKNSHFSNKSHWAFFFKIWKILSVTNLNRTPDLYQLLWFLSLNTEVFLLV